MPNFCFYIRYLSIMANVFFINAHILCAFFDQSKIDFHSEATNNQQYYNYCKRLRMEMFASVWRLVNMTPCDYHLNYVFYVISVAIRYTRLRKAKKSNGDSTNRAIRKQRLRSDDIRVRQINHDSKDALAKDAIL